APFWTSVVVLPLWAVAFASSRLYRSERAKKPLAYTNRLKRLLATAAALALVPVALGAWIGLRQDGLEGFFPYLAGFFVADAGGPLWVLLAAFLTEPLEAHFRRGFKRQARQTLQDRTDLTVIGITGSYGKTSTKFIIAEILRQRFSVLATPGSYNTPMGLCLVVNNKLKPEHQVLVLEFGMRYRGDIQELCALAPPGLAVVTSVGPAHLETMGSIENIAREKGDLLEYMRPGGPAVLNIDNEHVAAMEARAPGRIWRVSTEGRDGADITARDLRYGPEGATFTVRDDTGEEARFQTKLLGRHNVLNILLGVAVGREMGLRLRQIAHAVARIEPVEHRLALRQEGPVTIIDDAFNSNPVGARNAVEILGQFETGRRVIVTPGMVELGARQAEENRTFGEHIARHADLAVLIGERQTAPIREGLRSGGFPDEQTKVFNSLFDAQDFLRGYLRPGDVVLYENDLPDQYDEG
ncbi:MAG: UDP-N-acetylmuramoyl-tripeptide--D-alanyl-D-alanine ligase, partial [Rhodothermales bacterium]|nr:UDP-N-acetylmuramoyl-tripeptide--D-alanyl-D-alanine ligase [Rhodothermales bacterium]